MNYLINEYFSLNFIYLNIDIPTQSLDKNTVKTAACGSGLKVVKVKFIIKSVPTVVPSFKREIEGKGCGNKVFKVKQPFSIGFAK